MAKIKIYTAIITLILFYSFLFLVRSIDFIQNDDWIYYEMIERFLKGNFHLNPLTAPTFYLQGNLGLIFAKFISVRNLPVLTLFISVLNFFLTTIIIYKFFRSDLTFSLLAGLIFFFNPIHIYSIFGFMTENYFIFSILVSLYFIFNFNKHYNVKDFAVANLFIFAAYLIKQVALTLSLSLGIYLFFQKKYKLAFVQGLIFTAEVLHYFFVFPQTFEMQKKALIWNRFLDVSGSANLLAASLIYIAIFLFPLLISSVNFAALLKQRTSLIIFAAAFLLLIAVFDPSKTNRKSFPYFGNIFEKNGFFTTDISGDKSQVLGASSIYAVWEFAAKIGASLLLVLLVKKAKDYTAILIFAYLLILSVIPYVFDRYLLPLFPAVIFLVSKYYSPKLQVQRINALLTAYVGLLIFLNYQFTLDFLSVQNYKWQKSVELSVKQNIPPAKISSGHAWRSLFPNYQKKWDYEFSYDSPQIRQQTTCCFLLVENKKITFPLSIFKNSRVYLYKNLNEIQNQTKDK